MLYGLMGQADRAVSDYTQAVKLDPRDATTYCHRGIVNTRRNDLLGAIGDFSKAIELRSDYAQAYYNRGLVYMIKEQLPNAIPDFDAAIRCDAGFADAYCNRALAYKKQGDTARSQADLAEAERLKHSTASGL